MTITVLYHVSVTVPEDVYEWRKANVPDSVWDYEVVSACLGSVSAGGDTYGPGEELYAEFHTRIEAECCEKFLNELINRYKKELS